ncbi:MAG: glycoside hydrolase family 3 protein [Alphaproteobacteria bacterium]|nr:MAG: glycoside hydrolase family 3 protein [Alphaproteobacteria bacterium]TAF38893.1 MAG: glycoside hydrolase family 3 protein [Alphaproteobacteria bacterium]TAF77338.1 MAG: glycoside hydrolase family 3 protein [Alphaproteobacteria bacterium]
MGMLNPAILGIEGAKLSECERDLFGTYRPLGYILFARNCIDPQQLTSLIASLKDLHADYDPLILVDQEGGRVARLREPHWVCPPAPKTFADIAAREGIIVAQQAAYDQSVISAQLLTSLGFNVNCVPMADVHFPFSHAIIGDRAYGSTPEQIIALARSAAQGLLDHGILPVLKHIPGHGRALADSHESLPIVNASRLELEIDFAPFRALRDLPLGMTAHITYTALDAEAPATLSSHVIRIIREDIGFTNPLMTDDLCMKALGGSMSERAQRSLDAGCDIILHCNGVYEEMLEICTVAHSYTVGLSFLHNIHNARTAPT